MGAVAVPPRRRVRQIVDSLADPAFRSWFLSQTLSASGSMTQGVGQSWLVLKLTGSGVDLGLMTTFSFLPVTVTGSWAGALVDRIARRRLLIATQILFIMLSASLGALTASGVVRVWMVFAFAVAFGLVNAADAPGRQVYVLELVGADRLANAVSLNEVVLNASRVLGPAVGGILLVTSGVSACFFFNAVTFVPPLLVLLVHRSATSVTPESPRTARAGQVRDGLRYAWGTPAIRICLFMAAASGMLFSLGASLPLLATKVLRLGEGGYGLLMAVFGVGAIVGAMFAAAAGGPPSFRTIRVLAILTGLSIIATAGALGVGMAIVGFAATGCLSIWFISQANALVQMRAEPSMRGRVMGIWTMALPGATPVTSPLVGWVAGSIGAREGFGLAGIALLATVGAGWRALSDADTP
jgi:MFS family permease